VKEAPQLGASNSLIGALVEETQEMNLDSVSPPVSARLHAGQGIPGAMAQKN
jgi:hypothetical protein